MKTIACYFDLPWHVRHAQLCAITHREMRHALSTAQRDNWSSFAILMHTFELLRNRRSLTERVRPDGVVLRRLAELAAYLVANQDRYTTVPISGICRDVKSVQSTPIRGKIVNTVLRYGEQTTRRVFHFARTGRGSVRDDRRVGVRA